MCIYDNGPNKGLVILSYDRIEPPLSVCPHLSDCGRSASVMQWLIGLIFRSAVTGSILAEVADFFRWREKLQAHLLSDRTSNHGPVWRRRRRRIISTRTENVCIDLADFLHCATFCVCGRALLASQLPCTIWPSLRRQHNTNEENFRDIDNEVLQFLSKITIIVLA